MNASKCAIRRTFALFSLLVVMALCTATASAGTIAGVTMFGPNAGVGPGLGTVAVPAIITAAPNNDNQLGGGPLDNNIFVPIKRFDHNGAIDIEFHVAPSGGVTEYRVFESVDNNTGVNWSGYFMRLGHGVGPGFVPSLAGDGLDFDFPTYDTFPSSSAFGIVGTPDEDTLVFGGGPGHGSGAESYQVRIDVPDIATLPPLFSSFTLRQIPRPVPEPSTIALLGLAIAGFAAYRSRG